MARLFEPDIHSALTRQWIAWVGYIPGLPQSLGVPAGARVFAAAGDQVAALNPVYLVMPGNTRWPGAALVLKRPRSIQQYRAAMEAIQQCGASYYFPGPCQTTEGWTAEQYVPWEFFPGTWLPAKDVARCIVTLFTALNDSMPRPGYRKLVRRPALSAEQICRALPRQDAARAEPHIAELRRAPKLARTRLRLAHIDLHPHNMLVGTHVVFLDVESIQLAPLCTALGYAAFKLGRALRVLDGPRGSAAGALVSTLQQGLPARETEWLWLGAKAELLRRLVYIRTEERRGRTEWLVDAERHLVGLEEIDVLAEETA